VRGNTKPPLQQLTTKASMPRRLYWNAFTLWHVRGERTLPFRSLDEITAIQNRRVRAIVAHAYDTVPWYRETMDAAHLDPRDVVTAENLRLLPLITPSDLAHNPTRFVSRSFIDGRALDIASSGTSGYAKSISYDPRALFLALAHGHRQRHVIAAFAGKTSGYREMRIARETSVAFQIRRFYEANSWVPGRFDLERSRAEPDGDFQSTIDRLNEVKPDVVHGWGGHVGAVFRYAARRGAGMHRPRCITYGAEPMSDADRMLIENDFGVPVVSTYQAAEALRIGFQCEQRKGFHLSVDHTAVQVVDSAGDAVAPGERGEVIVSNLVNRATVLLNYRLGDVVTSSSSTCACGRSLPVIESIDGRTGDFLRLGDGRKLHALAVTPMMRVKGVVQVQLVQEDFRRFTVRAVCADSNDWDRINPEIATRLRSMLGDSAQIRVELVDSIAPGANGKVKAVISNVGDAAV
jgi:phenylacetate-CoA ligase